jgi:hypothetical protein
MSADNTLDLEQAPVEQIVNRYVSIKAHLGSMQADLMMYRHEMIRRMFANGTRILNHPKYFIGYTGYMHMNSKGQCLVIAEEENFTFSPKKE